tara:strand:- start:87 stop:200 length:114 start_codon:yes stop_codon:yes gene_type:complete
MRIEAKLDPIKLAAIHIGRTLANGSIIPGIHNILKLL